MDAAVDGSDVVGEIDIGGCKEQGDEAQEKTICGRSSCISISASKFRVTVYILLSCASYNCSKNVGWSRKGNILKINFSVGVSMYSAKVTSYW